jgi:uncharacterized membrane protein
MKHPRTALRWLLAGFVTYAGVRHFTNPAPFVQIVPRGWPAPEALVAISGAAEIAGGIGLLVPAVRRPAAWGLIALFVAVFPANVNMAVHHTRLGMGFKPWMLWARLPLQLVLIAWAFWFTKEVD